MAERELQGRRHGGEGGGGGSEERGVEADGLAAGGTLKRQPLRTRRRR
jgi:hypothetical protein